MDNLSLSQENEFNMTFLLQATDKCYDFCVNKEVENQKVMSLTNTETNCVKDCFTKYYVAYNSVEDLINKK